MLFFNPRFTFGELKFACDTADLLFKVSHLSQEERTFAFLSPELEINGEKRGRFAFRSEGGQRTLPKGWSEFALLFISAGEPDIYLRLTLRSYFKSPILRMKMRFTASAPCRLTRSQGKDALTYFGVQIPEEGIASLNEVNLSHFNPLARLYQPHLEMFDPADVFDGQTFAGPLMILEGEERTLLVGYEHGGDAPQSFLRFVLEDTPERSALFLHAVAGNYLDGQELGPEQALETPWFEIGVLPGGLTEMLPRYRRFIMNEICPHAASREPLLTLNVPDEPLPVERLLQEAETAHRLGLDVFIVDAARLPEDLQALRARLDEYGMRLGVRLNPQTLPASPEWRMTQAGEALPAVQGNPPLCLVSAYADHLARTMMRMREELGVTVFQWTGVSFDAACDSSLHHHGNESHTPQERADAYRFRLISALQNVVEQVCERYPEVLVDLDVSAPSRPMGLGFLAAGRYCLSDSSASPAQASRHALNFDPFVPVSLLRAPVQPADEQSLATLALGGNALQGSLSALPEETLRLWADTLTLYRRILPEVTAAYPRRRGWIGSSPEVHEKIAADKAAGVVSFFTVTGGTFVHLTQPMDLSQLAEVRGADDWEMTHDGRLKLTVKLPDHGGRAVFLIPRQEA